MKIKVTAQEVNEKGNWERFCEITGIDYYCKLDRFEDNETFEFTIEQAKYIGILPRKS